MKFIRVIKSADVQPKIEEYISIIDNMNDTSEFEHYDNPEELSIKSKIILLESVLNDLSKITTLDEISKNLFDLAKENNDYEDARNQFKVILVRADSDCVDKVLDKHL